MTLTAVQVATIAAIGSALVPLVVSFLKREHWSSGVKQLLAFATSVVVAVVGLVVAARGHLSGMNLASLVGLAYTGSQLVYQTYFRGSAFDGFLTALFSSSSSAPAPKSPWGPVDVSAIPPAPASPTVSVASIPPAELAAAVTQTVESMISKPSRPAPVSEAPTGPDGRPIIASR